MNKNREYDIKKEKYPLPAASLFVVRKNELKSKGPITCHMVNYNITSIQFSTVLAPEEEEGCSSRTRNPPVTRRPGRTERGNILSKVGGKQLLRIRIFSIWSDLGKKLIRQHQIAANRSMDGPSFCSMSGLYWFYIFKIKNPKYSI